MYYLKRDGGNGVHAGQLCWEVLRSEDNGKITMATIRRRMNEFQTRTPSPYKVNLRACSSNVIHTRLGLPISPS